VLATILSSSSYFITEFNSGITRNTKNNEDIHLAARQ